jgi:hypothetical protein
MKSHAMMSPLGEISFNAFSNKPALRPIWPVIGTKALRAGGAGILPERWRGSSHFRPKPSETDQR